MKKLFKTKIFSFCTLISLLVVSFLFGNNLFAMQKRTAFADEIVAIWDISATTDDQVSATLTMRDSGYHLAIDGTGNIKYFTSDTSDDGWLLANDPVNLRNLCGRF